MKKPLGILLSLTLLLTGIVGCAATKNSSDVESINTTSAINPVSVNYDTDDYYFDWKNGSYKTIALDGSSATVKGDSLAVQDSVVTISASGVYEISGTLTDGSIIVDVNKETDKETVFLVLNKATINSQTSAPIYIKGAEKAVILLEDGTENSVTSGSGTIVDADGEPSAAIFSKTDLTITGSGTLAVTADYNDGITSRDDLKITDGTLIVYAKADGIVGKDSLNVKNGSITITAGKDGMRSTNETDEGKGNVVIQNGQFTITVANDAIQAAKLVQIDDGNFKLNSGGGYPGKSISSGDNNFGGRPAQNATATTSTENTVSTESTEESKKGLKAGQSILVNGGNINISSYEDSVHSNNDIAINGGILSLESGDDGVHADNNLLINNGEITIKNSYESLEGTNITVNGGKINVTSTDDGINVNNKEGVLNITGGEVALKANGDGLDSNGSVNMTGGTVYVDGPTANNNGALDYDGSFTISGGTLVASGSSGMAQAPNTNSQPSILMNYTSTQTAGSTITLKDKDGTIVATYTPSKQYNSVAISSPQLSVGSTYTLYTGDTKIVDFALSDSLTYLAESGVTTKPQNAGPGGGGKGAGGQRPQ
ncbi:carbohydrate-binding domain-containing protein [Desulfosporosinus fructosivorans]|uniref:Carbohydrate-binding domain-containing protein n=1 Tax=Desulfosporosinus fructosivorans TaxID=2018669 RepID=A0A4Z0QXP3_9FIRM|nr:carbohydrate-binding domain-containing protein [Desulfosporosinus fructosivorans]TGE35542.1 carbohydrate-binding domain-containing protein [Desulfosporosinus fructosivorans]